MPLDYSQIMEGVYTWVPLVSRIGPHGYGYAQINRMGALATVNINRVEGIHVCFKFTLLQRARNSLHHLLR